MRPMEPRIPYMERLRCMEVGDRKDFSDVSQSTLAPLMTRLKNRNGYRFKSANTPDGFIVWRLA